MNWIDSVFRKFWPESLSTVPHIDRHTYINPTFRKLYSMVVPLILKYVASINPSNF